MSSKALGREIGGTLQLCFPRPRKMGQARKQDASHCRNVQGSDPTEQVSLAGPSPRLPEAIGIHAAVAASRRKVKRRPVAIRAVGAAMDAGFVALH